MDPMELAIMRGRLQQIVDEMDLVHIRAAFSPLLAEMSDRANAVVDAGRREVVMQGTTGLPIFVSTMQAAAVSCLEDGLVELGPGDVLVMNDPYLGGTHLQDVKMVRPFFAGDELMALLLNTGHLMDIGGSLAGGFDPSATDIFQEGLQISPTFLVKGGELRRDVLRLLLRNMRLPELQEGDLLAQLNALEVGERRLGALVAERGAAQLRDAVAELADRSEQQMRRYLSQVRDGTYRFKDRVEVDGGDLEIVLSITFSGSDVTVDFDGSSPAYDGSLNMSRHTTITAILCGFKHLFPDVPINGGCFRPFTFRFPGDCFLDASPPHAVGGFPESSQRVMDALFGALAEALPAVTPAATFGTSAPITVSGEHRGRFFATVFPMSGGYGATRLSDGLVNAPPAIGLAKFPVLEASEHDFPILWERFEIRPDSGGAGTRRGGPGTVTRFRATAPLRVSVLGDRARNRPFGVAGGHDAAPLYVEMSTRDGLVGGPGVSKVHDVTVEEGGWVEARSPGGGGYGDPSGREPGAREEDRRAGVVTAWPETARSTPGAGRAGGLAAGDGGRGSGVGAGPRTGDASGPDR